MIQLKDICLSFGTQKVFDHISETIGSDQKLGLVGRNGSGKSTLIKAIDRQQELDGGSIVVSGKARIAYMPQDVVTQSKLSILEEALSSYKDIGELRQRAQALELLLPKGDSDVIEEYANITERLSELNVEFAIAETKKMLMGLGFKKERFDEPVDSLSVGWKMRVILAKLLLQKADFYLFDEPTNHLDIVAKDWFLEFLKEADFGFILVCHDKYFLDQLCTTILELDRGQGTVYYGNYTDYEDEKERRLESLKAAKAQQDKEIAQKKKFIERLGAKSSKAKQAKSIQKQLDKIERIEIPRDPRKAQFRFAETKRAGRLVLEVQDLGFSFDDSKKIFEHVTFNIERGEKVALVAPNGMGKTTLFNVICGKYKQTHGNVHLGLSVDQTIFEQDQTKVLDPNKTVYEEVMDNTGKKTEQDVRRFLGSFLFGKEEIGKKTKVLSGGEKNRVSMVKVLLQDANFLLLDEPTNHLDITSKELLLSALTQFDGTMLFVSHDHDFVNNLATRIIELTPSGIHSYFGNYESFLAQKEMAGGLQESPQTQSGAKKKQGPASKEHRKSEFDKKKEIQKLERKIEKLEKDIERINMRFADLEYGTDEFSDTQRKSLEKEKELKSAQKEWEELLV